MWAIALYVTTHAVLLGSGHSYPQAGATGEQRAISIEHRGRAIPKGTPGSEFIDELKPAAGDIVLPVYRPDAFFGTPLDPILKWNGIKTVVFLGIHADTVAVQTLSRAWYLGYFRVVVSDATLSGKPTGRSTVPRPSTHDHCPGPSRQLSDRPTEPPWRNRRMPRPAPRMNQIFLSLTMSPNSRRTPVQCSTRSQVA